MSFIGSLLGKLCDSGAFSWSCSCFNNQPVVMIGRETNQRDLEFVQGVIRSTGRDLKDVTHQCAQRADEGNAPSALERSESDHEPRQLQVAEDNQQLIDMGIVRIANHFLDQLRTEIVDGIERKKAYSIDEGWAFLNLACILARVDLKKKLLTSSALTKTEWKKLSAKVALVKQFGFAAVSLWKLVLAHGDDIVGLVRIGAISKKQYEILKAKFRPDKDFSKASHFMGLSDEMKETFFDAAQSFSRGFLACAKFESLLHREEDNNTNQLYNWDRSANSSPRLGAHNSPRPVIRLLGASESLPVRPQDQYDQFCGELGNVRATQERQLSDLRNSLGIYRSHVLAVRLGLKPETLRQVMDEPILVRLRAEAIYLHRLDGAIVYLFNALKETIDTDELEAKRFITKEFLDKFILLVHDHPDFFYALQKAKELAALSPQHVTLLSKAAENFTIAQWNTLNQEFSLDNWIAARREPTPPFPVENPSPSRQSPELPPGSNDNSPRTRSLRLQPGASVEVSPPRRSSHIQPGVSVVDSPRARRPRRTLGAAAGIGLQSNGRLVQLDPDASPDLHPNEEKESRSD